MKEGNRNVLILLPFFLSAVALILSGCHGSAPAASPAVDLPVVDQRASTAEILADGSIQIASDQLVEHIGIKGVFVLSANNLARFRMVKAGKQNGSLITISSGLIGNEQILTGPFESLYDGSPVRLMND